MSPTIVLITGANRGIGKGILELYLEKPNHTVIAANRDPTHPTSTALTDLPKAEGTTLLIVKNEATSPTDPAAAVKELAVQGISHIDILVANASTALNFPKVSEVKAEDIQKHVDVNIYGFIRLYQAFRPLLKEAKDPKWVTIGSSSAFLTASSVWNFYFRESASYGPTKVVQHWYTKAISNEDPWLTAFPLDPGWVRTDIGRRGAEWFGVDLTPAITVEESATGLVNVIDTSTRETHSGKLFKYNGNEEPW
ncbi:putative NADPH-dependent 1-acyl dihydroxyacetone phosphate reductase [Aspergillus sclerotiicarbonarius CBS 121057]|uniref:Putative NADPH-dependent 1-acyl dihydroxyacetone phosphate reductase n=1 Tax=Aspergillus sclerotiicarbonarius (strain CBS 121057 / IBT 28362) TaxID=1448318 RepID=A0A319EAR5_ASPSB|nr:putative NADPH-dependent 1-acyl dihydroxyacetone phosphate reductase [Aspergillus sclerotiicarbonarius CBS 121057]